MAQDRADSRSKASEARIEGLNDPTTSYRQSVQDWEAELTKKQKFKKNMSVYIMIFLIIIFLIFVAMKYAFHMI